MKKNLITIFFLASITTSAMARLTADQIATCALVSWKASGVMAASGDVEKQKTFFDAGAALVDAGQSQYGRDYFNSVAEKVKPRIMAMDVNALTLQLKTCNSLKPN